MKRNVSLGYLPVVLKKKITNGQMKRVLWFTMADGGGILLADSKKEVKSVKTSATIVYINHVYLWMLDDFSNIARELYRLEVLRTAEAFCPVFPALVIATCHLMERTHLSYHRRLVKHQLRGLFSGNDWYRIGMKIPYPEGLSTTDLRSVSQINRDTL